MEFNGVWDRGGECVINSSRKLRDELRYFLEDPEVPPDNNACERLIRGVAMYRKTSNFKQSQVYTDAWCRWMTIAKTAEMYGIKRTADWLENLAHGSVRKSVSEGPLV